MTEPTITCPKCKNEIKLTESLALTLITTTSKRAELRTTKKNWHNYVRSL